GPLRELAGVEVEEFYPLDTPVPVRASWQTAMAGESRLWAERLRPLSETTEILARFGESNGWLDGGTAVTRHPVGTKGGQVVYVGAVLNDELQADLMRWLVEQAQVTPVLSGTPRGVEAARRVAEDGRAVLFLLNHNRQTATLPLPAPPLPASVRDLLTGETFTDALSLPPYGVRLVA